MIRTLSRSIAAAALLCATAPRIAAAQAAGAARIAVTVGPGIQLTTTSATTTTTFEAYSEDGTLTAGYSAKYQPTLEGGVEPDGVPEQLPDPDQRGRHVALVDGRDPQYDILRVQQDDPQLLPLEAAHLEQQPIGNVAG